MATQESLSFEESKDQILVASDIEMGKSHHEEANLHEELFIHPEFTFFAFINPTSGGNLAYDFIELGAEKMSMRIKLPKEERSARVDVLFFNLKDTQNKERGFKLLKSSQVQGIQNLRVIVGGGDGTVMWVIHEMLNFNCEFQQTPFGIVPFGTGNDFARVLGWGGSVPSGFIGKNLKGLNEMIEKWMAADITSFDIWDIKFKIHEGGSFLRVENENGKAVKKVMKDEKGEPIQVFKKSMSNYFSIGVDARIGLGFDRHRTTSQLGNKCVYCWEGFKKMFLRSQKVGQVLDALEVVHQADVSNNDLSDINISIIQEGNELDREVLFNTRSASIAYSEQQLKQLEEERRQNIEKKKKNNFLKGNPACLLVMNIPSYAGGTDKIWKSSKGQVGLEKIQKDSKVLDQFSDQNYGDGKLEFVSFTSAISLANERFFSGRASRIAQGKGPFYLSFKKQEETSKTPIITYFQIDGEYCQIISPKSVTIRLNKKLPDGKIRVLQNKMGNSY